MTAPGDPQANGPQPSPIVTIPRAIHYEIAHVTPPSYLHLQQEDDILVTITAPTIATPFSVNLEFRVLYPPSTSQPESEIRVTRKTVLVNATSVTLRFSLNEGFILSASASMAAGATAARGQVFVQMFVVRGIASDLINLWTLISDYVTTSFHPTWPNSGPRGPLEGPGNMRNVTFGAPGGGAEFLINLPPTIRWRLIGLSALFTTSAAVANRIVHLGFTTGGNTWFWSPAYSQQAASLGWLYNATQLAFSAAPLDIFIPVAMPLQNVLLGGWKIGTSTTNIQGADVWGAQQLALEEWVDI